MRDTSCTNKDHAVGSVVGVDVAGQIVSGDSLNVLLGSEDSATKRLTLERSGVQVIEHNLFQLLVNLFLFPKDNITLALDCGWLELGVLKDIGENVDSVGDIRVEGLGIVDGVLTLQPMSVQYFCTTTMRTYRSVGVEMSTHVFNLKLQLTLASLLGSLLDCQSSYPIAWKAIKHTLKARCSKKCAVPLVLSVSARLPASIQTPTVDV